MLTPGPVPVPGRFRADARGLRSCAAARPVVADRPDDPASSPSGRPEHHHGTRSTPTGSAQDSNLVPPRAAAHPIDRPMLTAASTVAGDSPSDVDCPAATSRRPKTSPTTRPSAGRPSRGHADRRAVAPDRDADAPMVRSRSGLRGTGEPDADVGPRRSYLVSADAAVELRAQAAPAKPAVTRPRSIQRFIMHLPGL